MPRENSFSDEDGRSLTPDLDEDNDLRPQSPVSIKRSQEHNPKPSVSSQRPTAPQVSLGGRTLTPKERFRSSVRKVMQIKKTSAFMSKQDVGAEPGVDVRRESASLAYGHIRQQCVIELVDYSTVRSSFGRMTNREFINYLSDPQASAREPWVKVRWINIGGLSWDVIRALALKYGTYTIHLHSDTLLIVTLQICTLLPLKMFYNIQVASGPRQIITHSIFSFVSSAIPLQRIQISPRITCSTYHVQSHPSLWTK